MEHWLRSQGTAESSRGLETNFPRLKRSPRMAREVAVKAGDSGRPEKVAKTLARGSGLIMHGNKREGCKIGEIRRRGEMGPRNEFGERNIGEIRGGGCRGGVGVRTEGTGAGASGR
jgi:hypothetical protein